MKLLTQNLTVFVLLLMVNHIVGAQDFQKTSLDKSRYYLELNVGTIYAKTSRIQFGQIKNGFSINRNLDLAVVNGLEQHRNGLYLPLKMEIRFNFGTKKFRPFVSLSGGYLQILKEGDIIRNPEVKRKHSGWSGSMRLGVPYPISSKMSLVSSLGYRFHSTKYDNHEIYFIECFTPRPPQTISHLMHSFELSIGLIFR